MAIAVTAARAEQLKRQAKKLARRTSITHAQALDRLAADNGFGNWSLLSKHVTRAAPTVLSSARPTIAPAMAAPKRYYLHGDAEQGQSGKFYCAQCDLFVEGKHFFLQHPREETLERCLNSIERWERRPASETADRRPVGAPNVLEKDARAAAAEREAARAPFHRWLERRRGRDSILGDLAGDVFSDKTFPAGATTLDEMQSHMLRKAASHEALQAMAYAWKQFQAAVRRADKREREAANG